MNVLILTPDAVGSTLLQRLLTIYMQFHKFDQPVINLHELTNGLFKFYSSDFNREIISRRGTWGYFQSLREIVDTLNSVDHYKTARLAQYHLRQRQDSLEDQLPFYQYLNDNFYIISCRRENLFEHAMSHAFNAVTRKLNVFSAEEKLQSFYGLYRSGLEVQPEQIYSAMDRYRDYLAWVDCYFSVGSYFSYETHLSDIERYILSLPVFNQQTQRLSWKDTFDIEFDTWNRCHYYHSDIGSLALNNHDSLLQLENNCTTEPKTAVARLHNYLPASHREFLKQHNDQYQQASQSIAVMQKLGILISGVPIKKQTLMEKLHMIRNLDQCVDAFNHWCDINPGISDSVSLDQLQQKSQLEYHSLWDSARALENQQSVQLPNPQ